VIALDSAYHAAGELHEVRDWREGPGGLPPGKRRCMQSGMRRRCRAICGLVRQPGWLSATLWLACASCGFSGESRALSLQNRLFERTLFGNMRFPNNARVRACSKSPRYGMRADLSLGFLRPLFLRLVTTFFAGGKGLLAGRIGGNVDRFERKTDLYRSSRLVGADPGQFVGLRRRDLRLRPCSKSPIFTFSRFTPFFSLFFTPN
jgi:hypothetical protein